MNLAGHVDEGAQRGRDLSPPRIVEEEPLEGRRPVLQHPDQIAWVLTSYIVAAAIMTPPTGFLTGRLRLKRLFLTSVAGFTVASMLCGMAQSLVQVVLFRILQGAFGAALVPLSQSVRLDIYPKERQGSAMALWACGPARREVGWVIVDRAALFEDFTG